MLLMSLYALDGVYMPLMESIMPLVESICP